VCLTTNGEKPLIEFLKGILKVKKPSHLLIEVGGIGYGVEVPFSVYYELGEEGTEVKLFTHLYIRENMMQIYGFLREIERDMFVRLLSVSGIGPRTALGILSRVSPEEFEEMLKNSPESLSHLPGIGKKMGQKIVLELAGEIAPASPEDEITREAIQALVTLGVTNKEATALVRKTRKEFPNLTSLEEIIKESLRKL